jgi:hypothetical protein
LYLFVIVAVKFPAVMTGCRTPSKVSDLPFYNTFRLQVMVFFAHNPQASNYTRCARFASSKARGLIFGSQYFGWLQFGQRKGFSTIGVQTCPHFLHSS